MKYNISLLVITLFVLSCTSSNHKHLNKNENAIDTVEEDNYVSNEKDEYYAIESIGLYDLLPKRKIIEDVFNKAIDIFNKREVYLYLHDYDYFYITIYKDNNSDTICYIGYENHRLLDLNNLSYINMRGYMNWGQYPVLVYGSLASRFYNLGDKPKVFHRGDLVDWSLIEGEDDPNAVAFVISGNRFWEANNP